MIVQSIIAAILVVIGVIILAGKGDMLIAGYNTASEEEKQKVNIKRLRLLIGGLSVIIAPLFFIPNEENEVSTGLTIAGIVVVLTIIVLVLANTWAMKK